MQSSILYSFGDMRGSDSFSTNKVGDGASHFQNAMMCASRKIEMGAGLLQQSSPGIIRSTESINLRRAELCIGFTLAIQLPLSCQIDSGADGCTVLAAGGSAQFIIAQCRNLYLQVYPIQQRTRNSAAIACHLIRSAAALTVVMSKIAARA